MPAIWCVAYTLVLLSIGYVATSLVLGRDRRSWPEVLGLSLLLGAGVMGLLLVWISMIGVRPSRAVILTLGLVACLALAALIHAGRTAKPLMPNVKSGPMLMIDSVLMLLLFVAAVTVFIATVRFPLFEWDSIAIWGFKAKILSHEALTPYPRYFSDLSYSYSHHDYPLLLPMLMAAMFSLLGTFDDAPAKIFFPIFFVGGMFLAYSACRNWVGRRASMMLTLICLTNPLMFAPLTFSNFDFPFAMFYLGSIAYLMRWLETDSRADLLLCALFSLFLANSKSEGIPLAAINVFAAGLLSILLRRSWRRMLAMMLIVGLGVGFWLAYRAPLPHTNDNYFAQLRLTIVVNQFDRIGTILRAFWWGMLDVTGWSGIWIMLPIFAILGLRAWRHRRTWLAWSLLLIHLLLYIFVYIITDWNVEELLNSSLQRMFMHLVPAAMIVLAVHWNAMRPILDRPDEPQGAQPAGEFPVVHGGTSL